MKTKSYLQNVNVVVTVNRIVGGQFVKANYRKRFKVELTWGDYQETDDAVREQVYTDWSHIAADNILKISWNYV